MALSEPIMLLLYPAQKASAINAAPSLFILAFGVIFLATVQTLTGVLQGIGRQMIPVRNLAVGALVKVVLTYSLTGIPSINIRGAAIGTVAAYIVASTLNLLAVKKITGAKFLPGLTFGRPLAAATLMGIVVVLAYKGLHYAFLATSVSSGMANAMATLVAIVLGAALYLVLLFAFRAIKDEELVMLPGGVRLERLIRRIRK